MDSVEMLKAKKYNEHKVKQNIFREIIQFNGAERKRVAQYQKMIEKS